MRRAPYLLVEGMVIAGLVSGAQRGWVYIRHEFEEEIEAMEAEIKRAVAAGLCGERILGSDLSFPLEVYVSPGNYICGEESALLEAMEDRRAEPRNKPPFPVQSGLYNKPTVINNVETLSWVPAILSRGGEWYRDQGARGATGLRFVSISGDVNAPGVYEVPFGQTVRELIDLAGGVPTARSSRRSPLRDRPAASCPRSPKSRTSRRLLSKSMSPRAPKPTTSWTCRSIRTAFGKPVRCWARRSWRMMKPPAWSTTRLIALNSSATSRAANASLAASARKNWWTSSTATSAHRTRRKAPALNETRPQRTVGGDERRLDLRTRPNRLQPVDDALASLPRRTQRTHRTQSLPDRRLPAFLK